jgi:ABC-type multidrug transport system ATPase subunit
MGKIKALRLGCHMGDKTIFSDLSFSCRDGEALWVSGRNGSGKSLLLQLLCGAPLPCQGALQCRSSAGKKPVLIPDEIRHDLEMRCSTYLSIWGGERQRQDEEMGRWGLEELKHTRLKNLSHGQRKRLLIACGLSKDSDILCLDEPTSGLDITYIDPLFEKLITLMKNGTTVVVASHEERYFSKNVWKQLDIEGRN